MSIVRYKKNLPMFIIMPDDIPPAGVPMVIFNHERPFHNVSTGMYRPNLMLSHLLSKNGIASAYPIRRGYYSAGGVNREGIPCNSPEYYDFKAAGSAATKDILSALNFVKTLPDVDKKRIFVGGTSAGGFASICSIASISKDIQGIFSLNGGRCGKRGDAVNGINHLKKIYRDMGSKSTVPVVFFAGSSDRTIPLFTTQELYQSFCEGRGPNCKQSVNLIIAEGGTHKVSSMLFRIGEKIVQFVKNGNLRH